MDSQLILNILVTIIALTSVVIAAFYYLYLSTRREKEKQSRELQQLATNSELKSNDLTPYKIDTDTWKSLEDIIGGLRELSLVKPDADKAFLSIVQVLLTSFLESLGFYKKPKSFPDYQNISFMIMINDTDGSIHYSKDWKKELITGGEFYQGNVTVTNSENEYFEYRFTGTGINCFVGVLRNTQTLVDIYFDKNYIGQKIIPASQIPTQQSVFLRDNLKREEHTIKIALKEGALALDAIGIYI